MFSFFTEQPSRCRLWHHVTFRQCKTWLKTVLSLNRTRVWLTCCSWTCTALRRRWEGSWTGPSRRWGWRRSSRSSTPHGQVAESKHPLRPLTHSCRILSGTHSVVPNKCRYAVPVRGAPPDPGASAVLWRGADRDAGGQPGAAAEPHDLQAHRPLPGRGVGVAEQAVSGRLRHRHLVRGAAHLDAPGEHLHRLRGHPLADARGDAAQSASCFSVCTVVRIGRLADSNLTSAAHTRVSVVNWRQALIGLYSQLKNSRCGDFLIAPKVPGSCLSPDVCC